MFNFGDFISFQLDLQKKTQQIIADSLSDQTYRVRDQSYISRKLKERSFRTEEWKALADELDCEDIYIYGLGKAIYSAIKS